ncbi:MAG: proline racemase family protein [Armatimonadetes bacterium]|nr:proline racemase family protein [Armatimonadota bacterium]
MSDVQRVQVVDSHTGGEPTRVVVGGGPDLGGGSAADRLRVLRREHDGFRTAVVGEPRGSDVLVGALLIPPADTSCAAGAIFFNNVGYLGMCGHGTIGLMATLAHLGRIGLGEHKIETPVGVVTARQQEDGAVSVRNVSCYRYEAAVCVPVDGYGTVCGDVAWGGNWFFLAHVPDQELSLRRVGELTELTWRIRRSLTEHEITGRDGEGIDHIELYGPSPTPGVHSRNFVLCPGGAYDRSPCGTGTSAKLACLYADGKLKEGDVWRQEGITGSVFEGSLQRAGEDLIPTITGRAFVTAESALLLDPADPLRWGIRQNRINSP